MCFCAYGVSNGKKHFFFFLFLPLNCIYLFGVLGSQKKTKTNCSLQCTGITVVQWKRCTQNMLASMVRCSLFKPQQNEEKNRTNNDVIAPFRFCTKRWNISLWFFCFFFVNSLLLKTCVPCVHAKKRNNQQWQRRVNRHFIATVAQFVCKKSHHPTVTYSRLPNIPRRRLLGFCKHILYYMHVNWFITVGKKAGKLFASMMIRSILLLYASEYVLFTHCMSHYLLCACSCSCLCLYLSEMPIHRLVKHTHLVNRYHAVSFSRRHSADKCKINKQQYICNDCHRYARQRHIPKIIILFQFQFHFITIVTRGLPGCHCFPLRTFMP